ncbi:MAG TPA: RuvA C-terminal domain-containing protein, partial [Kofleriaceae bacterium]|nr:RuvA C-terminal domain-containing protein [Kofleriaceae bacterium]
HGGGHEDANLLLLCGGHHRLLHDGLLTITGRAPGELTFARNGVHLRSASYEPRPQRSGRHSHAERKHARAPSSNDGAHLGANNNAALAEQALRQLGFKAHVASRAVELASAHVGTDAPLPDLIKAALRTPMCAPTRNA